MVVSLYCLHAVARSVNRTLEKARFRLVTQWWGLFIQCEYASQHVISRRFFACGRKHTYVRFMSLTRWLFLVDQRTAGLDDMV